MSITEEMFCEELKKLLEEEDSKELHEIADELLDLNKEKIIPLTKKETYYLRHKLIHQLDGTNEKISISQISMTDIKKALNNRIKYLKNKKDKLSALDYLNKDDININEIFDEQIEKLLRKSNIYSLRDLLAIDTSSIRNLYQLGEKNYKKILKTIHEELNLVFIDEIPIEERNNYLNKEYKKNKEKMLNSNIDWLDFNRNKQKRLKSLGIITIKDAVKNLEHISNRNQSREMLNCYQIIKTIEKDGIIEVDETNKQKEKLLERYNYLLGRRKARIGDIQEINRQLEELARQLDNIKQTQKGTKRH